MAQNIILRHTDLVILITLLSHLVQRRGKPWRWWLGVSVRCLGSVNSGQLNNPSLWGGKSRNWINWHVHSKNWLWELQEVYCTLEERSSLPNTEISTHSSTWDIKSSCLESDGQNLLLKQFWLYYPSITVHKNFKYSVVDNKNNNNNSHRFLPFPYNGPLQYEFATPPVKSWSRSLPTGISLALWLSLISRMGQKACHRSFSIGLRRSCSSSHTSSVLRPLNEKA